MNKMINKLIHDKFNALSVTAPDPTYAFLPKVLWSGLACAGLVTSAPAALAAEAEQRCALLRLSSQGLMGDGIAVSVAQSEHQGVHDEAQNRRLQRQPRESGVERGFAGRLHDRNHVLRLGEKLFQLVGSHGVVHHVVDLVDERDGHC